MPDVCPNARLLAEALVIASYAYGDDQWARSDVVKAFLRTLPTMRDLDVQETYRHAERAVRQHGVLARIRGLERLPTLESRRQCLVLAIDVALSSGVLDDGETLEAIRLAVGVSDRDAHRYADVLRHKYAAVMHKTRRR